MRKINQIVVHCSATRCDRPYTEADLTADHLQRGFSEAGIIIIYVWTETSKAFVLWWNRERMWKAVRQVSAFAMKVEWTKECPCFEVKRER